MTAARAAAVLAAFLLLPASACAAVLSASSCACLDDSCRYTSADSCSVRCISDTTSCRSRRTFDGASLLPLPFFAAGLIARTGHGDFNVPYSSARSKNTGATIDDCLRFGGIATATILKACGYEGRSDWGRYTTSAAFSYTAMAATVFALKHAVHETRPDGSADNSFPSGHTAVAFTGAAILHKEYGTTRSPWFSVAGFGMATATGILRARHNRHWASDIMVGAGVGILSADIGYLLADAVFKEKGVTRRLPSDTPDLMQQPFALSLSMGTTVLSGIDLQSAHTLTPLGESYTGLHRISDDASPLLPETASAAATDVQLSVASATHVGGELSWFPVRTFPYIGTGIRVRLDIAPVIADGLVAHTGHDGCNAPYSSTSSMNTGTATDRLTLFSHDAGLFLRLHLGTHLALGAKAMAGIQHRAALHLIAQPSAADAASPSVSTAFNAEAADRLDISSATNFHHGIGISLTLGIRGGSSCTVYCDYDRTDSTLNGTLYTRSAICGTSETVSAAALQQRTQSFTLPSTLHQVAVGVAMGITF